MRNIIYIVMISGLFVANSTISYGQNSSKYKSLVNKILWDLQTNYLEKKKGEVPLEINTHTRIIQNTNFRNGKEIELDTSYMNTRTYVSNNLTILSGDNNDVYYTPAQVLKINHIDKSVILESGVIEQKMIYETEVLRKRASSMLDSLADGNWNVKGNLLALSKNFSVDSKTATIESVVLIIDIEKKKAISQTFTFINHLLIETVIEYQYPKKILLRKVPSFNEFKNNSKYKEYRFENNLTEKK